MKNEKTIKPFDAVEVHRVCAFAGADGNEFVEQVGRDFNHESFNGDDVTPAVGVPFWSVYLRRAGEGLECVADCPLEEYALLISSALEKTISPAIDEAVTALEGDSNDAEHDALYQLVSLLRPSYEAGQ